jgi:putative addiction module component (TIGR02574 family)
MSESVDQIIHAALSLPEDERLQVVDAIVQSIGPQQPLSAAWLAEIERRSQEIDDGTATMLTWKEVKASARRRAAGG